MHLLTRIQLRHALEVLYNLDQIVTFILSYSMSRSIPSELEARSLSI